MQSRQASLSAYLKLAQPRSLRRGLRLQPAARFEFGGSDNHQAYGSSQLWVLRRPRQNVFSMDCTLFCWSANGT
ncbi:hypothetical protein NC651_031072 [Populus alba x Populus x berolinensis]|nr:hypothetical protein NC651_031072 [Populus alba x Populus x berolinensis]